MNRSLLVMMSRFSAARLLVLLLAVGVAIGTSACSSTALDTTPTALDTTPTALDTAQTALDTTPGATATSTLAAPSLAPPVRYSDLPTITLDELPDEALDTLRLIQNGPPYPYSQDGSTFQNREGILPDRSRGHYEEFTVETPGLSHRGARRFVHGEDGALYYTDDHYNSFRELVAS